MRRDSVNDEKETSSIDVQVMGKLAGLVNVATSVKHAPVTSHKRMRSGMMAGSVLCQMSTLAAQRQCRK